MTVSPARLPRWQRSLLPAMLGADRADRGAGDGARLARSPRDWLVDVVIFLGAVGLGVVSVASVRHTASTGLLVLDIALGLPALAALWVRRDHPAQVGLVAILASAASGLAAGAAIAAVFTAVIYCRPRRALWLLVLALATSAVYPLVYPHHSGGYDVSSLVYGLVFTLAAAAFGAFVRARRDLVLSLHERNRRLQDEQALRVHEARLAERNRIAREMHDVLAHRISLLSVHAGALEFHPDAAPEEIARAAQVIRESARAAQEELREVVGVLRTGAEDGAVEPPQPTLADLRRLVAESQAAGMAVRMRTTLEQPALASTLARTVYRVVQEALTNIRKHAPSEAVVIDLAGSAGGELRVEVVNRPRVGTAGSTPSGPPSIGSGTGLIGLGERVGLAGGTLVHGPLPGGGFRVQAVLPWPVA